MVSPEFQFFINSWDFLKTEFVSRDTGSWGLAVSKRTQEWQKPQENRTEPGSCQWLFGKCQHIGSRAKQEDNCAFAEGNYHGKPALLAILADGMGGMHNGAAYSRIAVDIFLNNYQKAFDEIKEPPSALLYLAMLANREANRIYDDECPGGTTLLSALFIDDVFYTLSIGDSRIALFRPTAKKELVPLQINRVHVLGASLDERAWSGMISFEDADGNTYRNSLTASIGSKQIRRVDLTEQPYRFLRSDWLVLMSDGIFRSVSEYRIAAALCSDPQSAAENVVNQICAKNMPDQDNMSILVIKRA